MKIASFLLKIGSYLTLFLVFSPLLNAVAMMSPISEEDRGQITDCSSNLPAIPLFILAGQSNMVGHQSNLEDLPPQLRQPQPGVLWYNREDQWTTLQAPTEPFDFSPRVVNGDGFGPEITLGVTIARRLQKPVAMVKYAQNGTDLESQWNPKLEDSLYHEMMVRVQRAIAQLCQVGYRPEVAGFFWMQGESDAKGDSPSETLRDRNRAMNYAQNLTQFISRLRQDLNSPQLPFIQGLIFLENNHQTPNFGTFEYGEIVRHGQLIVDQTVSHTRIVETRYFPRHEDNLHLNSFGLIHLGYYFALQWLEMHGL
ncbi:sialate O-acetylesterase [Spirulina subsalsa FACHB-351]|uniref:Sialate O-acetylesterase n=1 Tax=Spirulina subsalsa FACHB-351 TaxID=234711 RepID=A0ABT3L6C3_9CYAN|nr:sialate O-acetylesterase [Spirulina subsalsa]MCW6037049.1 sialate O-acetylesterase [Spirulina subsalsa FACHB-351]